MTRLIDCARQRGVATRDARVKRNLRRFRPAYRHRVRALARAHPWLADLAVSFPAVLFALACPRRGWDPRPAQQRVREGASLARIAKSAGVPLWMRRFPPEAFGEPLPWLPDTPRMQRGMPNSAPKSWSSAPCWLRQISEAAIWSGEEAALWFAREAPTEEHRRRSRRWRPNPQRLVCLWTWFSGAPDTAAGSLVATPWRRAMSWRSAVAAAWTWCNAVDLTLYLGTTGVNDPWLKPGCVDGFAFAPLQTAQEVAAEASAMEHCVGSYGLDVAENCCRLWSVRRNGVRVATLSLRAHGPLPDIDELSGPGNAQPPIEVWLAARRWLYAQDAVDYETRRLKTCDGVMDPTVWRRLWRPYWLAKRRIPAWLPLTPTRWPIEQS